MKEKISIAPRVSRYSVPEPEAQRLRAHGLPTTFEAISIGLENGGPQVAIIPLDESSRENAERIVKLWNQESRESALVTWIKRLWFCRWRGIHNMSLYQPRGYKCAWCGEHEDVI